MSNLLSNNTITLTNNQSGDSCELPVISGSVGPDVIDIRKLYSQTGLFTFDPGYGATGSCLSGLTYIDGDQGILLHRGYPIDQLADQSDFLEVAFLLLNGELPNQAERDEFVNAITHHTMVHEQISTFFRGFRRDAHPMAILCGVTGALSAFYHDSTDINDENQRMIASRRLIAKMPTLAAMAYKYSIGQPFNYPRNNLSYAENFLHMCFSVPAEEYQIDPVVADAMDKIFILDGIKKKDFSNQHESFGLSKDLDVLNQMIEEIHGASMVIIDPVNGYLDDVDSYNNSEVRRLLTPLSLLASRHKTSIIMVSHPPKTKGTPAVHKVSGSVAFIAAARSGFLIIRDPPRRRSEIDGSNQE